MNPEKSRILGKRQEARGKRGNTSRRTLAVGERSPSRSRGRPRIQRYTREIGMGFPPATYSLFPIPYSLFPIPYSLFP
ncbi:MAG: hypothetical protein EYR95_11480, partial [Phormidium sp. SL48-SHIP]